MQYTSTRCCRDRHLRTVRRDRGPLRGELLARICAHFALDDLRDLMDDFESGRHVDMDGFAVWLEVCFAGHFRSEDTLLHHALG